MKILNVVWSILCLIGNIYQLYLIFHRYFQFEVATNVQIYIPEVIEVPTVILCIEISKLLKWDNLQNVQKNLNTSDLVRLTSNRTTIFDFHPFDPNETPPNLQLLNETIFFYQ